ncbi:hypothetical protein BO82DRAFT_396850 [Aspergillus uvarum CBS 121591]|uniref:HSF-type DNA-binding domain-containing protein n=1 Tax=Aspergillus uvarum CBS 121591 TaxID=1448315 RepID=A0A319BSJ4_9EURO|nr:hypothetical protein BO82DRAFT_396850 [Aspergillus uvarum CBS 121591]PYH75441.1 hypothetical protein BO82DRAFT_396850 [Aspergillus uvarum CBS 121591]
MDKTTFPPCSQNTRHVLRSNAPIVFPTAPSANLCSLALPDSLTRELSIHLDTYHSVLNAGSSIAIGRGQCLFGTRVGEIIATLFKTKEPTVVRGPQISWTSLILAAGPNYDGPNQLTIGDSDLDLSQDDLDLIKSGRPWRFLSPWPGKDDCQRELRAIHVTREELRDTKEKIEKVLQDMSALDQKLSVWHNVVTQLHNTEERGPPQSELGFLDGSIGIADNVDVSEDSVRGESGPGESCCDGLDGDRKLDTYSTDQVISLQPANLDQQDLPSVAFSDDSRSRRESEDESQVTDIREPPKHTEPFIQCLSDVLDDSQFKKAICWSEDGRSFTIPAADEFPPELLARFNTQSCQSLVRRLYYFGFHASGGVFWHGQFVRGQASTICPSRRSSTSPIPVTNTQRGPRYKIIKKSRRIY